MNKLKKTAALTILIAGTTFSAQAQQPYAIGNNATTLLGNRTGAALNNETPANPGNTQGQLIQLGYFSAATDSLLFAGVWKPLAQFLSGDSASGTSNVPNGRIILTIQFDTSGNATNSPGGATQTIYSALNPYPLAGSPLAIRWFDTKTTAGFYNTVSATNWDWTSPTGVPATALDINLATATGLAFEAPATTSPYVASIPEPTTALLLALGALVPFLRRRRR